MPKRKYSREFKVSAVKLVNEQGYSIVDAAKSLGIDPSNLRHWMGTFAGEAAVAPSGPGALQAELRRLRKVNAQLLMERENLKKSGGILRQGAAVKFSFIKEHRVLWPVAAMCRVLKVSRSGFFAMGGNRYGVARAIGSLHFEFQITTPEAVAQGVITKRVLAMLHLVAWQKGVWRAG